MKPLDELTTKCIRCGFCLESCPTFVVTGEETESPRGRIYLVRSADEGKLDWEDVRRHIDQCLGCRACETACPSGVEYGQIFEIARAKLETQRPNKVKKAFLAGLTRPLTLHVQLALGKMLPGHRVPAVLSQLLSGHTAEADKPQVQPNPSYPPFDEPNLPPVKGEVYLLEGCVMRVLFPHVHQATRRLLRRVGYTVRETGQGCCGSLHLHVGYLARAQQMGQELLTTFEKDIPIIVNSAGCGSTLKEYPKRANQAVFDASEFLFHEGLTEQLQKSKGLNQTVTYHDACHLSNGQGIRAEPRKLLQAIPGLTLTELNEADMCCGSAGVYNVLQPEMARTLLDRKFRNIESTGASIVAMGNPGCHAWIAQAAREHGSPIRVMHTLEVLEGSFSGIEKEADA